MDVASAVDRPDGSTMRNASQMGSTTSKSLPDEFRSRNMALAIPVFLVGLLRPSTLNVLIQYTSKYFDWKLSQAAVLVSEVAAVNLVLFLVIVPQGMRIMRTRYEFDQQVLDLAVVRASMIFLAVGALLLGVAPNIPSIISCISQL